MKTLLFATGNNQKFAIAQHLCESAGISLEQFSLDSDEIQSEDPEYIIRDKAARKFALTGNQPVIVSDDIWDIPALNGFPGAYMKYVDHWFSPQQILDLMTRVTDRRIYLHQYLAYKDSSTFKIFSHTVPATITDTPRGTYGKPAEKVIALDQDEGLTIAEVYDNDPEQAITRFSNQFGAWHDFIAWFQEYTP